MRARVAALIIVVALLIGYVFYAVKSRKSPEQEKGDRAVAEAMAYGKAAAEGNLRELPDGTYVCTVTTIGENVPVMTSCEAGRDMNAEERRDICRENQ